MQIEWEKTAFTRLQLWASTGKVPLEVPFSVFFFFFIPWPHWGIVWFNSGPALIYICGRIILQLLKIMSAVRRLNQGQRQLPPSMASFHFMDIYFVFGPTKWPAVRFFLLFLFYFSVLLFFLHHVSLLCWSSRGFRSFWLGRHTHTHIADICFSPENSTFKCEYQQLNKPKGAQRHFNT